MACLDKETVLKEKANSSVSVRVSLKKYDLDAVRYAAHAVSGAAYVFISPAGRGTVAVKFTFKPRAAGGGPADAAKLLQSRFREELADEKLRAAIADANRGLREFMILKALSYEEPPAPGGEDSGLTPEQEKELDALIAQVESEIKKESSGTAAADPLGITRTWEERYGAKAGRAKK